MRQQAIQQLAGAHAAGEVEPRVEGRAAAPEAAQTAAGRGRTIDEQHRPPKTRQQQRRREPRSTGPDHDVVVPAPDAPAHTAMPPLTPITCP